MSVFEMFRDKASEYSVVGKDNELMFTTRKGRGTTVSAINSDKTGLMEDGTRFSNGDLCTNVLTNETYFITAMQSSAEATRCLLKRTNATISIVSIEKHYTPTKVNDYDYELPMHDNVTSFYEDINGKMQMYDIGLKATTTRRFIVPMLPMKLTDRVKFNGENMLVEVINSSAYPGLLQIQCSPDNRKTKAV